MANVALARLTGSEALEAVYQNAVAGAVAAGAERRKYPRYPCTAMVWLTRLDDHFPARDELQLAMCHDVSLDGISFYYQDVPDNSRVGLSLSRSTEMLLEARVVSSHAVDDGASSPDRQFVIHCEFIGRLSPERFA